MESPSPSGRRPPGQTKQEAGEQRVKRWEGFIRFPTRCQGFSFLKVALVWNMERRRCILTEDTKVKVKVFRRCVSSPNSVYTVHIYIESKKRIVYK